MANPLKGEVELRAGEQTYIIRYSVNAICELEDCLGKGFPAIAADLQKPDKLTISTVRHLLHVGLTEAHPQMSLKEAGELIVPAGGIVVILEKVSAAITLAFPQPEEASGTNRPRTRPTARTG